MLSTWLGLSSILKIFLFDIRGLESKRPIQNFGIRRIRSCSQIVLANRFRSIQNFDSFDPFRWCFDLDRQFFSSRIYVRKPLYRVYTIESIEYLYTRRTKRQTKVNISFVKIWAKGCFSRLVLFEAFLLPSPTLPRLVEPSEIEFTLYNAHSIV